jgi:hypothetical protein
MKEEIDKELLWKERKRWTDWLSDDRHKVEMF